MTLSNLRTDARPEAIYIEVESEPAGLLIANRHGYRFYASDQRFASLEGQHFKGAAAAERAARNLLALLSKIDAFRPLVAET